MESWATWLGLIVLVWGNGAAVAYLHKGRGDQTDAYALGSVMMIGVGLILSGLL